ncbi:hypothetical protein CKAH01_12157 [Colletotrichum kahawae]|uniref:Uncharacterized protein n=1 Tax=Colletotrichum kahawae TaxID=34407 RepID=A0AAE0DD74_COLKA|nr:hypothetical protein CKAH01_12157 [Colletotrichum kahawae]
MHHNPPSPKIQAVPLCNAAAALAATPDGRPPAPISHTTNNDDKVPYHAYLPAQGPAVIVVMLQRMTEEQEAPWVEEASRLTSPILVESRRACRVTQVQYRRVAFIGHDRSTLRWCVARGLPPAGHGPATAHPDLSLWGRRSHDDSTFGP